MIWDCNLGYSHYSSFRSPRQRATCQWYETATWETSLPWRNPVCSLKGFRAWSTELQVGKGLIPDFMRILQNSVIQSTVIGLGSPWTSPRANIEHPMGTCRTRPFNFFWCCAQPALILRFFRMYMFHACCQFFSDVLFSRSWCSLSQAQAQVQLSAVI